MRFQTSYALLCASLSLTALLAASPTPAPASGLPTPGIPQSCGVNYHFRPFPADIITRFGETGYGFGRTDIKWEQIESKPGVYDFSVWDKMTDQLASVHSRALYTLTYGNPIYDHDAVAHAAIKGPPAPPRSPEAVAAYAKYCAAAAAHFKGHGVMWEIYNEPDCTTFWKTGVNAEEYATMAVAAAKAMREADPDATIIAPALGGTDFTFMKPAFRLGILKYIDGVSWHPYRRSNPETVAVQYDALQRLIAQYTVPGEPVRPIVASEWGYATTAAWKVDEAKQARYMIREWLADMALGVDITTYYDWRDDAVNPTDQEANFGTLHNDYSPKPSGLAAKALFDTLNGYTFVHRLARESQDDWSLLFHKDKALAVVSWSSAPDASADAATPKIRLVSATDPDYPSLLRTASIGYHAGLYAFSAQSPAHPAITVSNPEEKTAQVELAVGSSKVKITLQPGEARTFIANPFAKIATGQDTNAPVQVTWNGQSLSGLPSISGAAIEPIEFTLKPRPDGLLLNAETFVQPFHGTLNIVSAGQTKRVKVNLDAYQTLSQFVPADPEATVQINAVDNHGTLFAQSNKQRFVSLAGMPHSAKDNSGFIVVPMPNNQPGTTTPARTVPAGDGAPAPFAIEMPYETAQMWLYTTLTPKESSIPNNAMQIIVWVKSSEDNATLCARYVDATNQWFQPGLGQMSYKGWRPLMIPLRGQMYGWGGASDGIQHLPLTLNSIMNVEGSHRPAGNGVALLGPAYYAIDEGK